MALTFGAHKDMILKMSPAKRLALEHSYFNLYKNDTFSPSNHS
jgi:hypothetical protein